MRRRKSRRESVPISNMKQSSFSVFSALAVMGMTLFCSACSKREEPSKPVKIESPAPEKPLTQFYYDLGPPTVDVSAYPEKQKENYRIFLAVCGACHTTARPLNSPHAKPGEWKRFVDRMHNKMESRGIPLGKDDADRIVEFLVFDSKIRKTDRGESFQSQQEKLKALFEEISKERERLITEKAKGD